MESRFFISNKSQQSVTIDIDGYIGNNWDSDANSKEGFKARLKEVADLNTEKIIVNIDSLGGDLFDAISIHDILVSHPAKVEVNIFGMTASAATVIAMAGDVIRMSDNALLLVHRSSMLAMGNKNDLETALDDLTKYDDKIANIYAKRTGKSKEYHLEQMDKNNGAGEWLTPQDAKEMGYVDEVFEPAEKKVAASVTDLNSYNLPIPVNFKEDNTMDEIKQMIESLRSWIQDTFKKPEDKPVDEFEARITEVETKYQAMIAERDETIESLHVDVDILTAEKKTLADEKEVLITDKSSLEAEVSALKAMPVDVKDKDPDITDTKAKEHPFDAAAKEMKTKLF